MASPTPTHTHTHTHTQTQQQRKGSLAGFLASRQDDWDKVCPTVSQGHGKNQHNTLLQTHPIRRPAPGDAEPRAFGANKSRPPLIDWKISPGPPGRRGRPQQMEAARRGAKKPLETCCGSAAIMGQTLLRPAQRPAASRGHPEPSAGLGLPGRSGSGGGGWGFALVCFW